MSDQTGGRVQPVEEFSPGFPGRKQLEIFPVYGSEYKKFRYIWIIPFQKSLSSLLQGLAYYDKLVDAYETKYSSDRQLGIQRLADLCEQNAHLI